MAFNPYDPLMPFLLESQLRGILADRNAPVVPGKSRKLKRGMLNMPPGSAFEPDIPALGPRPNLPSGPSPRVRPLIVDPGYGHLRGPNALTQRPNPLATMPPEAQPGFQEQFPPLQPGVVDTPQYPVVEPPDNYVAPMTGMQGEPPMPPQASQQPPPMLGMQGVPTPYSVPRETTLGPQVSSPAPLPAQATSDDTWMAFLAAGLGILANNTGHYGQAGPAIGKGGMMGLQMFQQVRQNKQNELYRQQQMQRQQEQTEINRRQVEAQTLAQRRENDKAVAEEAIIRQIEATPPGAKRAELERLLAFRQGHAGQLLRAQSAVGAGNKGSTEAERSLKIVSDYAAKEQSGAPTTPEEDRAYANALALLQAPRTYVDPVTGNVYSRPKIDVPTYADAPNGGLKVEDVGKAQKAAGIEGRKPLDNEEQKELGALGKAYSAMGGVISTFQPGYGGMIWGPIADIAVRTGRALPRSIVGKFKDEAKWWMDYARWASVERLAQTGLTMTPAEQRNFESWTAVPSDSSDIVEDKIKQQYEIIKETMARRLTGLAASGKNMKEAEGYTGLIPISPEEADEMSREEEEKKRKMTPKKPNSGGGPTLPPGGYKAPR